ncbi:hypothetical protein [Phenylobacterium sp.]|uniref:hypothetical protein n=1 Tax=Phenylobacterium sp. TaxID=1871053 RepID=UPI00391A5626
MHEPRSFAYSLSRSEAGWTWSVYDEDGVTVARGAGATRAAAESALQSLLRTAPPGSAPEGSCVS